MSEFALSVAGTVWGAQRAHKLYLIVVPSDLSLLGVLWRFVKVFAGPALAVLTGLVLLAISLGDSSVIACAVMAPWLWMDLAETEEPGPRRAVGLRTLVATGANFVGVGVVVALVVFVMTSRW